MSVRIGLGLASFPFRNPASFFRWAELCEEKGVDSLWQSDRLVSQDDYLAATALIASIVRASVRNVNRAKLNRKRRKSASSNTKTTGRSACAISAGSSRPRLSAVIHTASG